MGSAVSYFITVHKVFVTAPDLFVHHIKVDFRQSEVVQHVCSDWSVLYSCTEGLFGVIIARRSVCITKHCSVFLCTVFQMYVKLYKKYIYNKK